MYTPCTVLVRPSVLDYFVLQLRASQPYLGVISVNDRRHGEDDPIGVVNDGINGRIADYWKILAELQVRRVEVHQLALEGVGGREL